MKKVLKGLVMLLLLVALIPGVQAEAAESGTCGNNLTWELDDNGTLIIRGEGAMSSSAATFPDTVTKVIVEEGVTSIGLMAFSGCSDLTEVSLPASLQEISYAAFQNCSSLEQITLPDSLTIVYASAFENCTGLKEIVIPGGVETLGSGYYYNRNTHYGYVFYGCTGLERVVIDDGVKKIETCSFNGCTGLKEIETGNGVTAIGSYAFGGCENLQTVCIPGNGVTIGDAAFINCANLETVDVTGTVTSIGAFAFENCTGLKNIDLKEGLETISYCAFRNCSALEQITLPESLTVVHAGVFEKCTGLKEATIAGQIESFGSGYYYDRNTHYGYVFNGCTSLERVVIGDGVKKLEVCTFNGCTSLKQIETGNGVTNIGEYAFAGCENLQSVQISGNGVVLGKAVFYNCANLETVEVSGSVASIGAFAFENCTSLKSMDWKEGLQTISFCAFLDCSGLEQITLPESLTVVYSKAFANCTGLTEITIPGGVEYLGSGFYYDRSTIYGNVFVGCTNLERVVIEDGVKTIGVYNFTNCANLKQVVLGNTIEVIGGHAFRNCTGLEEIVLKEGMKTIENCAFQGCTGLRYVKIEGDGVSVGVDAFAQCSALEQVEVTGSIALLNSRAFNECGNLVEINLPYGLKEIHFQAFNLCVSLEELILPQSLQKIGAYAFKDCTNLREITVPGGVTELGSKSTYGNTYYTGYAFKGCSGLEKITFEDGVKTINRNSFEGCTSLRLVRIEGEEVNIGVDAFANCSALEQVEVTGSIAVINSKAFSECTNLAKINLPYGLKEIHFQAFSSCVSLQELILPQSLKLLGAYALKNCTGLREMTIPSGVEVLGGKSTYGNTYYTGYTFLGCNGLEKITLENGVKTIEKYTFSGCTSLRQIKIEGHGVRINQHAFHQCNLLEWVETTGSIGVICAKAFENCTNLRRIDLPQGLTEVHFYAFGGCENLTELILPQSLTFVGACAFAKCEGLSSITIPSNVAVLGDYDTYGSIFYYGGVFEKCTSLTRVILGSGITTVYGNLFGGSTAMQEVIFMGNAPASLNSSAFSGLEHITVSYPENLEGWEEVIANYNTANKDDNVTWKGYQGRVIRNSEYVLRITDAMTGIPVPNCKVQVGEDLYRPDSAGYVKIFIDDIANYADAQYLVTYDTDNLELDQTGELLDYKPYTGTILFLNPNETNLVELERAVLFEFIKSDLDVPTDTMKGPDVEVDGRKYPIFESTLEFDLSKTFVKLPIGYKVKLEKGVPKTFQVIIGLYSDEYEPDDKVKPLSDEEIKKYYNTYKEIYEKLDRIKDINEDAGIDFDDVFEEIKKNKLQQRIHAGIKLEAKAFGYAEVDIATGKLQEGGIVLTGEADAKLSKQLGPVVVSGGIKGETTVTGKLSGTVTGVGFSAEGEFKLSPYVEAAAGLKRILNAGVGARLNMMMKFLLPAKTMEEAVNVTMDGEIYTKIEAVFFEYEASWAKITPAIQIYPKKEASDEGNTTNSDGSSLWMDDSAWRKASRDYLLGQEGWKLNSSATAESGADSIGEENVYFGAEPKMVKLEDGRIFAAWIRDDGTKSDNNRTTLYYSICDEGVWSVPAAVAECGRAEFQPELATEGNKVHLLWQRGTEVFSDDAGMTEVLGKIELVYSCFADGTFSEPVVLTEANGLYPVEYSLAVKNGNVFAAWMENSKNDLFITTGTNSVYTRLLSDGVWGERETVLEHAGFINSITTGFILAEPVLAYSVETEDDMYQLYLGDTLMTPEGDSDTAVSFQKNRFYWQRNEEICFYTGEEVIQTGVETTDARYVVVHDGTLSGIVFGVTDEYDRELYVSYEMGGNYTTPVALTQYGKAIMDFDAIAQDGSVLVLAAASVFDDEIGGYTTTDFICDVCYGTTDLAVGKYLNYTEDDVATGKTLELRTTVENLGTAEVDTYTIVLTDENGTVLAEISGTDSLLPGEIMDISFLYEIPEDFAFTEMTATVLCAEDENDSNNEVVAKIGYADIELKDVNVENGILTGTIGNIGFDTAEEITVSVNYFDGEYTLLETVDIASLEPGQKENFVCELPQSYQEFEQYYSTHKFIVEATTQTVENLYRNNECDAIATPIKVTGVTMEQEEVTVCTDTASVTLQANVAPANAFNKDVIWISDATHVATVDENGVVTILGEGIAMISAITVDGDFVASATVNVIPEHRYGEVVEVTKLPTEKEKGTAIRICESCGFEGECEVEYLVFAGYEIAFLDMLGWNYVVDKAFFESGVYSNPYVKVVMNETEVILKDYKVSENGYVFTFDNFAPQQMTDEVSATVCAELAGEAFTGNTMEYSLAEFYHEVLEVYVDEDYTELKALIVDTLNFGAAAQIYTGYKVDNLANANLTEEQQSWGSETTPETESVLDTEYATVADATAYWTGAGLQLQDNLTLRLKFYAEEGAGLTVKIVSESGEKWTIPASELEEIKENMYYVYFDNMSAARINEPIYVTVYDKDKAVSNTLCYSVESFIHQKQNSADAELQKFLDALLKYSHSANAYILEGGAQ